MMLFEVEDKLLLTVYDEQVDTDKALEHRPPGGCLGRLTLLVRETLPGLFSVQ